MIFRSLIAPAVLLLALSPALLHAEPKEEPVGMVMSAGGSKLLRSGTETLLDARFGDLLFAGDGLRTLAAPAAFVFCPGKTQQTLGPASEIRFEAKATKLKTGKITDQKPANSCFLPTVVRVSVASQQHYGVSMTRGVSGEIPPVPRAKLLPQVIQELAPIEALLAATPNDATAVIAAAAVYEKNNLPANALQQYHKVRELMPDAVWVKSKIFETEQSALALAPTPAVGAEGGKIYALLVGISQYKKPELALQYAAADAEIFEKILQTPRSGGVARENILTLTNERATTAAVRNGFQDFLKRRATKADTVIIMIAGHGSVETPGSKGAFILTYDSDPQDLAATALPMAELSGLFQEQLTKVARVILFVDVCKSGAIGSIRSTSVNADVQKLGEAEGDLLGLMASRPRELSLEGPQFGGGHGVFSYFVAKGLVGAADENKDGVVEAAELIKYVGEQVAANTGNKQHPREFGNYDNALKLAETSKPGMEIARWRTLYDSRTGEPLYLASALAQAPVVNPQTAEDVKAFTAAIESGRILPGQPGSAFEVLRKLELRLAPDQVLDKKNQLRIALENAAQEVLLRYLTGDQVPQTKDNFVAGAAYMKAALTLMPESLLLQARLSFFEARAALFDRQYPQAAARLEDAARLDAGGAYVFNALGIAYLEQAQFDKAAPAFRDAAQRAQHWSYPLHNLALTYVEQGNYSGAIRAYQSAIRLTPQYSYLPYNLGLVYQKTGRRKDAQASFRKALALAPDSAETLNAIGTLYASENRRKEAEQYFRQSLEKNPRLLSARQNLASLLYQFPDRRAEALGIWRSTVAEAPAYLPARLGLAQALAGASGQREAAIEQYRSVVQMRPEYTAARVALARLLRESGKPADALEQLRASLSFEPEDAGTLEAIGDLELAEGHTRQASEAYSSALKFSPDATARKGIRKKLAQLR